MKKLIPLMLLLFVGNGVAENIYGKFYGQFSCDVDSSLVTMSEDGRVTTFGGWSNGYEVGDEVKISYWISSNKHSKNELKLNIVHKKKDKPAKAWGSGKDFEEGWFAPGDRVDMRNKMVSIHWGIDLGNNRISANNNMTLDMYRYFKNDWAAVFNESRFYPDKKMHSVETVTFSCYHSRDRVDEVADELERLW